MIEQLKEKFQETKKRSERVQVLTVLPKSWSVKKMQQEFAVSEYLARQSKKLVEERGILSLPGPLRGPSLPSETVDTVSAFYESNDISRVMPEKKDFVSVKKEGKRQHVHKRLVLSNLREVYSEFKERFPGHKIGFSKFAEVRNTAFWQERVAHTQCVCVHNTSKCQVDVVRNADT